MFDQETKKRLIEKYKESVKEYWRYCEKEYKREFGKEAGKGYAKKHIELELKNLNEEEVLKEFMEVKEALKEKRLVLWHVDGKGLKWKVGIIKENEIRPLGFYFLGALCPYKLDYRTGAYKMYVYGTSRPLEIILNFGYSLGLKFKEIPQNQQILY